MGCFWSTGRCKGSSSLMGLHQRLSFLRLRPFTLHCSIFIVLTAQFGGKYNREGLFFWHVVITVMVFVVFWRWCPSPNDMKLHSDLVLVDSLRWDLMRCSAATQPDCPQPEILTGAFSTLAFSNQSTCSCVCVVCIFASQAVLGERSRRCG